MSPLHVWQAAASSLPKWSAPCHPSPRQLGKPETAPHNLDQGPPCLPLPLTMISWPAGGPRLFQLCTNQHSLWPLPNHPKPSEHTQGQTEAPVPLYSAAQRKESGLGGFVIY